MKEYKMPSKKIETINSNIELIKAKNDSKNTNNKEAKKLKNKSFDSSVFVTPPDSLKVQKPEINHKLDIQVLDTFTYPLVDIDGDQIPDVSHGDYVAAIVKNNRDEINIEKIEIDTDSLGNNLDVTEEINKLTFQLQNGKKSDGANCSWGGDIEYDFYNARVYEQMKNKDKYNLAKDMVTPTNIKKKSKAILKDVYSMKNDENIEDNNYFQQVKKSTKAIEALSKQTKLYIPSSNSSNAFSAWTLAEEPIVVGGKYAKGEEGKSQAPMFELSTNTLIDKWGTGKQYSKPVKNKNGKIIGYDVCNNGKIDFPAKMTSTKGEGHQPDSTAVFGTSFASPDIFYQDIEAKADSVEQLNIKEFEQMLLNKK